MEAKLNKESRAAIELMIADGIITRETAGKYFPEFKGESIDERMKKTLVYFIKGYKIQKIGDFTDERIIEWLEKQGEQKSQNRWRPTEEHLYWLNRVIETLPDTEIGNEARCELSDLLEQLNKLTDR